MSRGTLQAYTATTAGAMVMCDSARSPHLLSDSPTGLHTSIALPDLGTSTDSCELHGLWPRSRRHVHTVLAYS